MAIDFITIPAGFSFLQKICIEFQLNENTLRMKQTKTKNKIKPKLHSN